MQNLLFNQILDRFYKNKKINFYLLIFSSIIAGLFELIGLILIFQFILFLSGSNIYLFNAFFENNPKNSFFIGIGVILIYIFKNLFMIFYTKLNNFVLEDLALKINQKTLNNLLFQDFLTIKKINNKKKAGIFSKIDIVVWDYIKKHIDLFANLIIAIFLISFIFAKFTLCAIVSSVFIAFLSLVEFKILKKKSDFQNKNYTATLNKINYLIHNTIAFTKEIKLNNKEDFYLENMNKYFKKYSNLNKEKNFNSVFHIYFTEIAIMITFGVILSILYYSSNFNNQIVLSSLCTICVVILRFAPTINRIQSSLYLINSNKKAAQELIEFDNQFKNNCTYIKTKEKLPFDKSIILRNVDFSYDNSSENFKNINLEIKKGDFIVIVGKSGAGKTTIALLLAGLIRPDAGNILIDNVPIQDDNQQKWQNNISFMSQGFALLNEDIMHDKKDLLSLLDFKNNNLSSLSSGEQQRLALIEILNENKEVLILDEITSNQDVINQEKINSILETKKGQTTIIAITHRLALLKYATKIIYIDENIFDADTFENLKNKYENFQKMLELSNIS